jgi:hypothetical protein
MNLKIVVMNDHKKHKPQCKSLVQNHLTNSKWRRSRKEEEEEEEEETPASSRESQASK